MGRLGELNPGKNGHTRDYQGKLKAMLALGANRKAVGYFMVKMVGGPFFLPAMLRMMPKVWKQLQASASTLPRPPRCWAPRSRPRSMNR